MAEASPQPFFDADEGEEVLEDDESRVRCQALRFESDVEAQLEVPRKPGNLTRRDPVEGRGRPGVERAEGQRAGTLGREVISTRQGKGGELARREPGSAPECFNRGMVLTTPAHPIDAEWMGEAYRRVRKDAAVGVDGVRAAHYEADLEANLSEVRARRMERYGLRLHPDKTRRVDARRPDKRPRGGTRRGRSFTTLGFTHYWGRSGKGRWVVKHKTAKACPRLTACRGRLRVLESGDRLSRSLKAAGQWCRAHRHWSVRDQHAALSRKLRGHCACYGITGNARALQRLRYEVERRWRKGPDRRLARADDVGAIRQAAQDLSPPPSARSAQCVPLRSESMARGAGCSNGARPDPWEPRVGNCPRPPGDSRFLPAFAGLTGNDGLLGTSSRLDRGNNGSSDLCNNRANHRPGRQCSRLR